MFGAGNQLTHIIVDANRPMMKNVIDEIDQMKTQLERSIFCTHSAHQQHVIYINANTQSTFFNHHSYALQSAGTNYCNSN